MTKNKITLDFEDSTETTRKIKKLPKSFQVEAHEEDYSQTEIDKEIFPTQTKNKVSTSKNDSYSSSDIPSPKKTKPKMSENCDLVDLNNTRDSGKTSIYEDKLSSDIKIKELELKILEKQIELKQLSLENLLIPSNNLNNNSVKTSEEKVEQGLVLKTPSFIPDPVLPDSFPERPKIKQKRYFIRFWKNKKSQSNTNEKQSFSSFQNDAKHFRNIDKSQEVKKSNHTLPSRPLDSFEEMTEKDEIPLKVEDYSKLKRCPLCDSKLIKSTVKQEGNLISQKIKCKSKDCDFHKTIEFKI